MNFIPNNARLVAEELAGGLARNRVRVDAQGSSQNLQPGNIITFNLPEGLLHMPSFKIHLDALTTRSGNLYGKLPADAVSLISRAEIFANGASLNSACSEYNTVSKIKLLMERSTDRDHSTERMLSHSQMSVEASVDDVTLVLHGLVGGFLGREMSVAYVDTSLIGPITIRLTLADATVLNIVQQGVTFPGALTDASATPTYSVSNVYATCDVVQLPDVYGSLVRERITQQGYISILYKDYYSFSAPGQTANAASNRFNLSSASVDKLYMVLRRSSHDTPRNTGFQLPTNASLLSDLNHSNFFRFESFDSTDARDGTLRYQYNCLNVPHPQYRASVSEAMAQMAYLKHNPESGCIATSRTAFNQAFAVLAEPLCLTDEPGVRVKSGLNTQGVAGNFSLSLSGVAQPIGGYAIFTVAEVTSELRVGFGKQLSIIH